MFPWSLHFIYLNIEDDVHARLGGENKHTCPSLDKNFTFFLFDFLGFLGKFSKNKKKLLFVFEKGNFKENFLKRRYLEFWNSRCYGQKKTMVYCSVLGKDFWKSAESWSFTFTQVVYICKVLNVKLWFPIFFDDWINNMMKNRPLVYSFLVQLVN